MFPLSMVHVPGALLPLHVFEERYRTLMADCLDGDGEFGVVLIARGSEVGGGDQRVDIGTATRISHVRQLEDGRLLVMARGAARLRVTSWLPDDPYPRAEVEEFPVVPGSGDPDAIGTSELAVRRLRSLLSELGRLPALAHDLDLSGRDGEAAWQLCELAPLNPIDRQQLLAVPGQREQMELLTALCDAMAEDVIGMLAGGIEG
jgi:Lon protease-like protein